MVKLVNFVMFFITTTTYTHTQTHTHTYIILKEKKTFLGPIMTLVWNKMLKWRSLQYRRR